MAGALPPVISKLFEIPEGCAISKADQSSAAFSKAVNWNSPSSARTKVDRAYYPGFGWSINFSC
jgi:hypothetical protein